MAFRTMSSLLLAISMVLAGQASADSVRIVDGGPRAKDQRAAVERSLAHAAGSLGVCWKGERPDSVMVELAVDASGQVISAKQVTKGAVAQCVAGVLAVQTLAATGSRFQVRTAFATRSPKGDSIQAALESHRAQLDDCQRRAKAGSRGGKVALRFMIHADGHISEPKIQTSALADPNVERCLLDTIEKARLPSGLTDKTVSYSLALDFSGARNQAPANQPDGPAIDDLQPKKDGPLSGSEISAVMDRRKADFSRCYESQARKNRSLAGRVVLRFTIRDDGSAQNVKIRESTLNNANVESCMVKVVQSLRFPAEQGRQPTKVWYPFAFSPK